MNRRTLGALIALLAVLLGCFFMPDYVSGITDRNTLGKPTVLDAKGISFEAGPDLAMPERLRLIAGSDHESITLKNGKLSESEARTLVIRELRRFFGTSSMIDGLLGLTIDECAPMFVIDAEDPSINMIVWRALLSSVNGGTVTVKIDEETGVILQIAYINQNVGSPILRLESSFTHLNNNAESLCELIGEYYGRPTALKYDLLGEIGYYTVEMDFDSVPVALYGIVRWTSFSVNE